MSLVENAVLYRLLKARHLADCCSKELLLLPSAEQNGRCQNMSNNPTKVFFKWPPTAILRSLVYKKMNQTSHCTFCVVQTLLNEELIPKNYFLGRLGDPSQPDTILQMSHLLNWCWLAWNSQSAQEIIFLELVPPFAIFVLYSK